MRDTELPLIRQNTSQFSKQLAKSLSQNEAIILIVSLCHVLESAYICFAPVSFHFCHDARTFIETNNVNIKKSQ